MPGLLVLAGGAEFQRGMEEADKFLLEQAGGSEASIVILPTAGGADGGERMAARNGVAWFKSLGGNKVEAVMVVDRQSANHPALAAKIEKAKLIYMAGGNPRFLLECMQESLAWRAAYKAWQNGAILGGSSAGAMVLAEYLYDPASGNLVKALGHVAASALMPHHNSFGKHWLERLSLLLPKTTLLGIDEKTAMIGNGNQWQVYGKGSVTVYRAGDSFKFTSGQPFKIVEE
ncbi:MAG: Type 1 glutamine amidotransferase-like domain-containing protein [Chloroflexota bacterium]